VGAILWDAAAELEARETFLALSKFGLQPVSVWRKPSGLRTLGRNPIAKVAASLKYFLAKTAVKCRQQALTLKTLSHGSMSKMGINEMVRRRVG